jgi:hypothetical protein
VRKVTANNLKKDEKEEVYKEKNKYRVNAEATNTKQK